MQDISTPAKKKGTRVIQDRRGTVYTLVDKIGEGGQGIVCKTDIPNVLIKIFQQGSSEKKSEWSRHVQWLMRQNLADLKLARPVEMIAKPHKVHAYVMELMDGLAPLEILLDETHNALLDNADNPLQGFVQTGGLKRRILLLSQLAETLAKLHGRGYAYGDLSPANIFVSNSIEHHQLWLIDCDNICISERSGFQHFYTPGYGAPEVVRSDSGVNVSSDCWSFAVIAFKLLTNCHPFLNGLGIEDAEDDDTVDEFTEEVAIGNVPWIYDEDESNCWDESGIPLEIVATKQLRHLFERCFGIGRSKISERPSMGEWLNALNEASSLFVQCQNHACRNTFIFNSELECPFCESVQNKKDSLLLRHYLYNKEPLSEQSPWINTPSRQVINLGEKISLYLAPMGTDDYQYTPILCHLELSVEGLFIEPSSNGLIEIQRASDNKSHQISRRQKLKAESRKKDLMALHLRAKDIDGFPAHPVWKFTW